ncbi:MAG: hypothetical protein ABSC08_06110 [Bryobacteraceae bacterium]|jgi:hypothetical protein
MRIKIDFQSRAAIKLADNEKVSLWEPGEGTFDLTDSVLTLSGYWKVSVLGNLLLIPFSWLGPLIRQMFKKDRLEYIPVATIQRIILRRRIGEGTFHVFQSREEGTEVHVFDAFMPDNVIEQLESEAPNVTFAEERPR